MSMDILLGLITSVVGVLVGAWANHYFSGIKDRAEVRKLEAETEKTKIETAKLSAEMENKPQLEGATGGQGTEVDQFWRTTLGMEADKKVYAILSAKHGFEWEQGIPTPKPGHTALLSYNEVVAFLGLRDALKRSGRDVMLIHGGIEDIRSGKIHIPDFPEDETLVIVGSPNANNFCQRLLSSTRLSQIPFRFGGNEYGKCIHIHQDENGTWSDTPVLSLPSSDELDEMEEDFGILMRITNPRDAGKRNKVLVLGGNHGLGTESAVRFVTDQERVKLLNELAGNQDFEAVFQSTVSRKHGLGLGIRRLAVLQNGVWIPVKIV